MEPAGVASLPDGQMDGQTRAGPLEPSPGCAQLLQVKFRLSSCSSMQSSLGII